MRTVALALMVSASAWGQYVAPPSPVACTGANCAFPNGSNVAIGATLLGTDLVSTPANPSAGFLKFYAKGSAWCQLTSAGTETCIGAGGSVNVNGSSVNAPNFQVTTPAAESSSYVNAKFQVSGSSVSAEVLLPPQLGTCSFTNGGTTTFSGASSPQGTYCVSTLVDGQATTLVTSNLVAGQRYTLVLAKGSGTSGTTVTLGNSGACTWIGAGGAAGALPNSGLIALAANEIDVLKFDFITVNATAYCLFTYLPTFN